MPSHRVGTVAASKAQLKCRLDQGRALAEARCRYWSLCSSLRSQEDPAGCRVHHHEAAEGQYQPELQFLVGRCPQPEDEGDRCTLWYQETEV